MFISNAPDAFTPTPFKPPFWLANPHLQSILPKFFAPKTPTYRRVIRKDSLDETDIAYDFYDAYPISASTLQTQREETPLIVLFHGMEGSSDSHYARALAYQTHNQGWHFVVAHFRSCGGIPANGQVFYNAGDTDEVQHMLQNLHEHYANIYAVGVSLGGNALAKYMGEYGDDAICKGAVVISAPVDMSSAAITMHNFLSHRIYTPYLLNPIIKKALANDISTEEIDSIKSVNRISDFDHIFTAPRHGYRSNNHYYHSASALPHLINVSRPLLLISAKDDPFLGFTATTNDVSDHVTILETEHGGHVGFIRYRTEKARSPQLYKTSRFDINWLPETVSAYFQSIGVQSNK
ncbi:alpha/beta fold hydrolase [Psychrobacter sp. F1192]|uniref:Alpha/beta fold hydrolase n=1 Tax=Psychrobacter coccoides TaxID=2818440 RepID=A0ABS3NSM6_9GAMM|nr:alpha/beta fold hydrolase [Psychrobacter coccoides]MBO1532035.1 alpha/beta fold hydrolase [Psychrobacter coccoides]